MRTCVIEKKGHKSNRNHRQFPPMKEMLEYLCYDIKWSPKDSIFKLIFMLCLPKKWGLWEYTKASVKDAEHKEVQDLICHFAEEGKLIKLAALLCFAPIAPIKSYCFSSKYSDNDIVCTTESLTSCEEQRKTEWLTRIETLRNSIATKIVSLIVEEQKLMGSSKLGQICKEKKRLMMCVMLLLEIYERNSRDIGFCVNGAHGIGFCLNRADAMVLEQADSYAKILLDKLKESGFLVTNEFFEVFKHLNCSCDEEQLKFSGGACGSKFEQKDAKIPVHTKIQSPPITVKQTTGMPLEQQQQQPWSILTHSYLERPGLHSLVQSISISEWFQTRSSPKFCTATEAQTRKTFQVIRPPVPGPALSRKLSSFLSVIKRGK